MSFSPNKSDILRRTIDLQYENRKRSISLRWSIANAIFFVLFVCDLSLKCEGSMNIAHYVELCLAGVLGANLLQHAWQLLPACSSGSSTVPVLSPKQISLLGLSASDLDGSFRVCDLSAASVSSASCASNDTSVSCSPLSLPRAWRPSSPRTPSPPSGSPTASPPASPPRPAPAPAPAEFIADHTLLENYLKKYEERERVEAEWSSGAAEVSVPRIVPVTYAPTPYYQLSAVQESDNGEDKSAASSSQMWWRVHLDPQRIAEYNRNLRLWIHLTILDRLVREIDAVDAWFARHGQPDVRVGRVSVERLRSATPAPPGLASLLPFLQPFPDQQYAVQRIRELARGPCLSEYRGERGGSDWTEVRPSDAELVLALVEAYLEAALPARREDAPAVVRGRARGQYALALGSLRLAPARGRNNLLHALLLLLAAAARRPRLRGMHLGPAGLNMLWIIGR